MLEAFFSQARTTSGPKRLEQLRIDEQNRYENGKRKSMPQFSDDEYSETIAKSKRKRCGGGRGAERSRKRKENGTMEATKKGKNGRSKTKQHRATKAIMKSDANILQKKQQNTHKNKKKQIFQLSKHKH